MKLCPCGSPWGPTWDHAADCPLWPGSERSRDHATEVRPLTDLIGLDPNFTGGLSTEEHLRQQRCGECADAFNRGIAAASLDVAERDRLHQAIGALTAERDLLGRQHQALLDLVGKHRWAVRVRDLHQVLITDPGDDDAARYVDFTYSADGSTGVARLEGCGGYGAHTLFELDRERLRDFIDMAVSTYRFLTGGPDHCGLCGREECSGIAGDPDSCCFGATVVGR